MSKYHVPLHPDNYYHLFSRAIGSEKLFLTRENYFYFLNKMKHHILPVANVYTYSLLPNHFHLLVGIKSIAEIISYYEKVKKKPCKIPDTDLPDFIMERFSNWLNGYTKAFNKKYDRQGALFMDFLKRSEVKKDSDFSSFIFYIHKNAVHHSITDKIGEWPYDAYNSLLSSAPTLLLREEMIDWFGGKDQFIKYHEQPILRKPANFLDRW